MNMHLHVFYTWLLAHLLHPFLWFVSGFVMGETGLTSIEFILLINIIAVVGSIPALFVCMGLLSLIKKSGLPIITKAVMWLTALLSVVAVSFLFTGVCLQLSWDVFSILPYAIPALSAVFLSFFLRLQQLASFLTLNTINNENNLV